MEMHEPYTFLNGLTVSDMEDLVEDIQVPALLPLCLGSGLLYQLCFPPHGVEQVPDVRFVSCLQVYMELEQGKNVDFWRDMTIITEDEIAKLRKLEASGKGGPGEQESRTWCGCGTVSGGSRRVQGLPRVLRLRGAVLDLLGGGCGSSSCPWLRSGLLLSGEPG